MQAIKTVKRRPRQQQPKSCTECRRRRQKCTPTKVLGGPCLLCSRRYPPVECVGRPPPRPVAGVPQPPLMQSFGDKLLVHNDSHPDSPHSSLHRGRISNLNGLQRPNSQSDSQEVYLAHPRSSSSSSADTLDGASHGRKTTLRLSPAPFKSASYFPSSALTLQRRSELGSPRTFGGVLTAINCLNSLPIKQTPRNAELFHYFLHHVVPNLVSVDGKDTPSLFQTEMLPWMIQSPLMPNIAILMSSATQMVQHETEMKRKNETVAIKANVLAVVNNFLQQDFNLIGGEALRAVIHLAILEWFWGTQASLWAHMTGIKEMMRLRGGFEGMKDPLLVAVFILTDYELACCFEQDLFLQEPSLSGANDFPNPSTCPRPFSSPLLFSAAAFKEDSELLGLDISSADVLNDVGFLTTCITSSSSVDSSSDRIQTTASWLNNRLKALPAIKETPDIPGADLVYRIICSIAMAYSSCIMSSTAFSGVYDDLQLEELYSNIMKVGLERWKEIPGIFLWILLVICPSVADDTKGRFFKHKMAVTGMSIAMEDFNLATVYLRAFWKVQRWVARERDRKEEVALL